LSETEPQGEFVAEAHGTWHLPGPAEDEQPEDEQPEDEQPEEE
jgi:hypothetical protein